MSTSQPIRSTDELEAFRRFYLDEEPNLRNYAMICMGVNTALRISDLLELKWGEVYDFNEQCFRRHAKEKQEKNQGLQLMAALKKDF